MKIEELIQLKGQTFSLDTETTGLWWWQHKVIGLSVHCPALGISEYIFTCHYEDVAVPTGRTKKVWTGEYLMIPTGKVMSKRVNGIEITARRMKKEKVYIKERAVNYVNTAIPHDNEIALAREVLLEVMSDPKTTVIFHNSRFDCHMLGLDLLGKPCTVLDTGNMVHLYDSRLRKSLEAAEKNFLGKNSKRETQFAVPKGLSKKHWCWPAEVISSYGKNDAIVTYQLAEELIPRLRKLKLIDLLMVGMEYSKVLWQIERKGMVLNKGFCEYAQGLFSSNQKLMEQDLYDGVGYEFNWRSNPQLSKALYADLNFPMPINPFLSADGVDRTRFANRGKYNKYNTNTFVLVEKAQHPLGPIVMDLRETDKLRKAVEKYIELVDREGAVHTNFNQTGTRTGRLSSSRPNVQNIASAHRVRETQSAYSGGSIRQNEYNLRQAFMAREGYTFLSIDHAQQEQRLFAILANEPVMLEALRNRLDIHLMIAIAVWGDCGKERNKLHREWSKTISFGLLYGMKTGSLQFRLNKTKEEADVIVNQYWGTFPRVLPWLRETVRAMEKRQYIRYWSGRIWREEDDQNYYKGANAQVQGGAADLVQLAVIRAQTVLNYQGWGSVASIIHDEIMCEVKDEYIPLAAPVLVRIMELEDIFGLPFRAEAKLGKTYGDMEETYDVGDVSQLNWMTYLPPNTSLERMTIQPIKEYAKEYKESLADA